MKEDIAQVRAVSFFRIAEKRGGGKYDTETKEILR